jgi:hypothetical protein
MSLLTDILTFIGFIAITFGAAGHVSRAIKAKEERSRLQLDHHREVMEAISRLETSFNPSKQLP